MANRRPVNRATPQRRPASQRGANTRTTAADVRSTEATAERPSSSTRPSPVSMKKAKRAEKAGKSAPVRTEKPKSAPAEGVWQSWRTPILCAAAAVALAAVAIMGALRPGVDDTNRAFVDNAATDEVKAAADHALQTLYAYEAEKIDKDRWKADVATVLTPQLAQEFEKYLGTTVDTIKQTQTNTQVTTDPTGVTLLTGDRAELLVNLNVVTVKDGKPSPFVAGPILLRMQKVDGRWLASEIADK
ncbi:hypothetical protein JK358_14495 [Nocardia sp. 2]|uniref:Mce-associated membrane protein n=1 Tax=Nocardia acididurans TaxID=2802282 RepID=A0ABS1M5L3_9NOCA|nr:hypothetical protein [Nocardia acididurans]MBL1075606.1 hypothetical protein [Nocardia acididurans]